MIPPRLASESSDGSCLAVACTGGRKSLCIATPGCEVMQRYICFVPEAVHYDPGICKEKRKNKNNCFCV